MGRRIGLMGGTFNPIHNGHLYIANQALWEFALDEMWFLPNGEAPHKAVADRVSRVQRLEMVRLAVEGMEQVSVNDIEVNSTEKSYSYLTLRRLHEIYPEDEFYFIIGEDSLDTFHQWVNPDIISANATILVAQRKEDPKDMADLTILMEGQSYEELPELSEDGMTRHEQILQKKIDQVAAKYPGDFYMISSSDYDVSSTQIRQMVRQGQDISHLLPESVDSYIKEHDLYLETESYDISKMQEKLVKVLKPKRYEHTLGVMYTAASLAMAHRLPVELARVAGLLHDCAKYMSGQELLDYCKDHEIFVTDAEKAAPQLLHAKVGADFAKTLYGVSDQRICHAIEVHTTGCKAMSLLDKIIFTADYMEPNRDRAPRLYDIREVAFHDLDLAVTLILQDTINYLKAAGQVMDHTTIDTYEYYRNLIQSRS